MGVGKKFDSEKLKWELLPIECIEDVVAILTHGADKYGKHNWKELDEANDRYYAALLRHVVEWRKGNTIDTDSGLSHLAHAMCNLVFLSWFEKNKSETSNNLNGENNG